MGPPLTLKTTLSKELTEAFNLQLVDTKLAIEYAKS